MGLASRDRGFFGKMGRVIYRACWLAAAARCSRDLCKELGSMGVWLEQGLSRRGSLKVCPWRVLFGSQPVGA